MESRGQTNFDVEKPTDLIETGRTDTRPDGDGRRNPLTSIFWVPTVEFPTLNVVTQISDHVMLYHGGRPFEYTLYDPVEKKLEVKVLGPDILKGHHLQVPIKGNWWTCGRLIEYEGLNDYEYCILAEVFGPGFDVYDFRWVNRSMVLECASNVQALLLPMVNKNAQIADEKTKAMEDFDSYYDENKSKS